jgi:hypothetical protein
MNRKTKKGRKAKFRKGQVVAFKCRMEVLFRYGRIHADLLTIYDYRGIPEHGWRITEGNKFYEVPDSEMRPLTKRECGR